MKAVILVVASMTMAASAQEKFARLALDCAGKEYPNKIAHAMNGDEDAKPPRELTPAFYGCYDGHSPVHGHWLLARLARLHPEAGYAGEARAALRRSLTEANLAQEARYLGGAGRQTFERPYGLAGLNLSRAWMLEGMAQGLGEGDGRAGEWKKLAGRLREAGLRAIEAGHYEGGHWLGTFAVYLETGRGLGR